MFLLFYLRGWMNESNYCVYVHINKKNRKLYIGITNNIKNRWKKLSYKECKHFYNALEKYGWDCFEHIVLIDNIQKELAYECEKYIIQKYNTTNSLYGYNLAKGGTGGATQWGERHIRSKRVYQYDLNGNYIGEWINAQEASKHLGVCASDIHATCRKLAIKQAGGFQWSYVYLDKMTSYKRMLPKKDAGPPIIQFDINWNIVKRYENITYINSKIYDRYYIKQCCLLKKITYKHCFWVYDDENINNKINRVKELYNNNYLDKKLYCTRKPLYCYDKSKKFLTKYASAYEACDSTGIKAGTIQHACKCSTSHYAKGFYWYYDVPQRHM